jgi:hypothetical protein
MQKNIWYKLGILAQMLLGTGLALYGLSALLYVDMGDYPEIWGARGAFIQAIAALIMICVTISIHFHQSKIEAEEEKLMVCQINLSLYEKRYKIYDATINILDNFGHKDIKTPESPNHWHAYHERIDTAVNEFSFKTREKNFLFDDVLVRYINDIATMINKLKYCKSEELHETRQHICATFDQVNERFEPYLDFKKI